MHDLIKQIEQAAAGSVTAEVRLLKQRRKALDDVIKFTLGISHLQKSLESVLLLKQPANSLPRELINILGNVSKGVANLSSAELSKRLISIEKTIQQDVETIMGISNKLEMLDMTLTNKNDAESNPEKYHSIVTDFRRRTNTAIILKLHLRQRGIVAKESVIPVTTDALISQVSKLVAEEKKCSQRIIEQLQEFDLEIGKTIGNIKTHDEIKKIALLMKHHISKNIEHLRQGKDIDKLPFAVEVIELGTAETTDEKEQAESDNSGHSSNGNEISTTSQPAIIKSSFLIRLLKWFSSPWSVKWRDIK